jgi:ArsR family transcriptional regulator
MARQEIQRLQVIFKGCADETRLRLLNLLAEKSEVCVCDLVEVLGISQPKVSRHLAYLRRAGLVRDRKDGLWVYYRLDESPASETAPILNALREVFAHSPEMEQDREKLRRIDGGLPVAVASGSSPWPPQPFALANVSELEIELL